MPMAPLPPLKDPVGEVLGDVPVDVPDPLEGLNVLLMVEPIPEVDVGGPPELCRKQVRFVNQTMGETHTGRSRYWFRMCWGVARRRKRWDQ